MCRIMLIRERAVGILRFMPDLSAPWTDGIAAAREAVGACLDRIGDGAIVGMAYGTNGVRLRIETAAGVRQDCEVDATTTVTSVTEVAATNVSPDEGLVRFVPGSENVRPPECGLVLPVRDRSDAIIGRLIIAGC
jgi:hypothetical protein